MIFYLDGPAHARVRRAVAGAVHASVAALGPALVARHAAALVDRIATSRGEIDLVRDLAEPLPRLVLCDLLGLPHGEAATIYRQSVAFNTSLGGPITTRRVEAADRALRELRPRLLALATDPAPGSILASLRAAVDAGDLTEDELVASAVAMVAAGHETTTHLIANTCVALARNPAAAGPAELERRGGTQRRRRGPAVRAVDPADGTRSRRRTWRSRVRPSAAANGSCCSWRSANRDPVEVRTPRRVRARASRAPVRAELRHRPAPLPGIGPRPHAGRGRGARRC